MEFLNFTQSLNIVDYIIIVIWILAVIRGFKNGIVHQVGALLAVIIGIYAANHFSFYAQDWLQANLGTDPHTGHIVAFIITLVVVIIVILLLVRLLESLIKAISLGIVNRLLGAVVAFILWTFVMGVVLYIIAYIGNKFCGGASAINNSVLANFCNGFVSGLIDEVI